MNTKRYYELEPDQGCIEVSISDLTEDHKQYIRTLNNVATEFELSDASYKYFQDEDYKYYFSIVTNVDNDLLKLTNYLKSEGFKNVGDFWTDK